MGYSKLKPEQEKAILSFVFGNDVFVSLPTGYGKSLCFGLLPCVFDALRGVKKKSIVLVVCPLVALMKEHVVNFSSMGISAAYVSDKIHYSKTKHKNGEVSSALSRLRPHVCTCSWLARRGRERWPAKQADPEVRATRMHAK